MMMDTDTATEIIHNHFLVPESGVLRFNLHVPNPNGGNLKVSMRGTEPDADWQPLTTLWGYRSGSYDEVVPQKELPGVELTAGNYDYKFVKQDGTYQLIQDEEGSKINRIGYGTTGFETFHLDVPDELRGKVAMLRFELEGDTEVYLDDVFFKSEHLKMGNPTEAEFSRTNPDPTNYLIERPQYSLSYNSETKIPNWVAWQLDRGWRGDLGRPKLPEENKPGNYKEFEVKFPFEVDYALPEEWRVKGTDYLAGTKPPEEHQYDKGHQAASDDRSRHIKDQFATYLMSSIVPQNGVTNRNGPWRGLEKHTQNELVDKQDKNLYIFAGGYGDKNSGLPDGHPLKENQIKLPERLWKVVVVLEPGQTLSDVNSDTPIIAVDFPNDNSDRKDKNWPNYITTINEIEEQIKKEIPGFNLLSNVPEKYRKVLKEKTYTFT